MRDPVPSAHHDYCITQLDVLPSLPSPLQYPLRQTYLLLTPSPPYSHASSIIFFSFASHVQFLYKYPILLFILKSLIIGFFSRFSCPSFPSKTVNVYSFFVFLFLPCVPFLAKFTDFFFFTSHLQLQSWLSFSVFIFSPSYLKHISARSLFSSCSPFLHTILSLVPPQHFT